MDGQQKPQVDTDIKTNPDINTSPEIKTQQASAEEARRSLDLAKDRLAEKAQQLTLKDYMTKHPYISLGAAFFSGVLLGGSHEARADISRTMMDVIGKEVIRQREKH